jgi:hypothetical protein
VATFVLVHGGWDGGWAWKEVEPFLRAAGHDVLRPSLTGLGDRVHLRHPGVTMDTHVQDIVNLLTYEGVRDGVLVGWSYGGAVITGAAEHAAERLRHLVYLDAFVPEDGEALVDLLDPGVAAQLEQAAPTAGASCTSWGTRTTAARAPTCCSRPRNSRSPSAAPPRRGCRARTSSARRSRTRRSSPTSRAPPSAPGEGTAGVTVSCQRATRPCGRCRARPPTSCWRPRARPGQTTRLAYDLALVRRAASHRPPMTASSTNGELRRLFDPARHDPAAGKALAALLT